jgi:hypothetical protein
VSVVATRRVRLTLHGVALIALLTSAATFWIVAVLADDPERLHLFGFTIILHAGGALVVRSTSGRTWTYEAFTNVDPYAIWTACTLYLAVWLTWVISCSLQRRGRARSTPDGVPPG